MIKKTALFIFVSSLLLVQGCYDDYKEDFDYSATYFPRQYPLRTLISEEDQPLTFEIGAVLGGKYSNNETEVVRYGVNNDYLDPDLFLSLSGLEAAPDGLMNLLPLPTDYYTIESNDINIPSGQFKGSATVTINKDPFLNDPLTVDANYALPVEILNATSDSILAGKHYSIYVLKYINQYEGYYEVEGVDTELDTNGQPVADKVLSYAFNSLGQRSEILLTTTGRNEVNASYTFLNGFFPDAEGQLTINGSRQLFDMVFTFQSDGSVTVEQGSTTAGFTDFSGSATYDSATRNIQLEFSYRDANNNLHDVSETLIYRNTELVLEDWF